MPGKRTFAGSPPVYRFRPRVEELGGEAGRVELARFLSPLRASRGLCLLDGGATDGSSGAAGRFELLAFDPLPVSTTGVRGLAELRALLARLVPDPEHAARDESRLPAFFQGGFIGALSYDLGVAGAGLSLPRDPFGLPHIVGGLYVDFLVRDRVRGTTWLSLADDPGDDRAPVAERRAELLAVLERAACASDEQPFRPLGPLARLTSPEDHMRRIEDVRGLIERGELYQANISHRMTRTMEGDPVDLHLALRREHPGPYSAFLAFEGGALLSGSPELLLAFEPGARHGLALTSPIKGTAPRDPDPERDRANAAALLASDKERAELAMIVDLERNDLGRIARPDGVRVRAFPRLESYSTVHHMVADVVAETRPGIDAFDVLEALFPTGSITGAPKLRSMEAIAELEGEGRGFAYGSLGFVDLSGRAAWNVLIRTLIWRPRVGPLGSIGPGGRGLEAGEVSLRVGGGITHASRAVDEEGESLIKGQALLRVLEGGFRASKTTPGFPPPSGFPLMGSQGSSS